MPSVRAAEVFPNAVTALANVLLANAITTGLPFPITGQPTVIQHSVDVTNYPANARYRYTLQVSASIIGPWTTVGFFETVERGKNMDGTVATESVGEWTLKTPLPAISSGRVIVSCLQGGFFITSCTVRF